MTAALLLGCAITVLVTISMLWTISGEGFFYITATAVTVFSGMVIPLPLFPDWAQPILDFMPFRGLGDVPFRLYTGNIPAGDALPYLAQQAAWTVAMVVAGRWLLARGLRRLVVQGG